MRIQLQDEMRKLYCREAHGYENGITKNHII